MRRLFLFIIKYYCCDVVFLRKIIKMIISICDVMVILAELDDR